METTTDLLAGVRGPVLDTADPGYDAARAVYNGMIDRRPDAIVRCADAADVIAVVDYARKTGAPLSVRGGGHNAVGLGVCDDGIVADLSAMRSVRVDPKARTVRVGGGATWGRTGAGPTGGPAGVGRRAGVLRRRPRHISGVRMRESAKRRSSATGRASLPSRGLADGHQGSRGPGHCVLVGPEHPASRRGVTESARLGDPEAGTGTGEAAVCTECGIYKIRDMALIVMNLRRAFSSGLGLALLAIVAASVPMAAAVPLALAAGWTIQGDATVMLQAFEGVVAERPVERPRTAFMLRTMRTVRAPAGVGVEATPSYQTSSVRRGSSRCGERTPRPSATLPIASVT